MSATATAPTPPTPLWVEEHPAFIDLSTPEVVLRVYRDWRGVFTLAGRPQDVDRLAGVARQLVNLAEDREAHRQSGLAWEADPCADWRDLRVREGIARAKAGMAACDRELAALGYGLMDPEGEEHGN